MSTCGSGGWCGEKGWNGRRWCLTLRRSHTPSVVSIGSSIGTKRTFTRTLTVYIVAASGHRLPGETFRIGTCSGTEAFSMAGTSLEHRKSQEEGIGLLSLGRRRDDLQQFDLEHQPLDLAQHLRAAGN